MKTHPFPFITSFLFVTLLLFSSLVTIPQVRGDASVIYNAREFTANAGINEISQSDITGTNPEQTVTINYRPQSDTIYMFNAHGFNGSQYGFYYEFDFKVDYDILSYVILTTATGDGNTTIFESNTGTSEGHLGWNTSFTHVSNDVFLAGIKDFTNVDSDVGNQDDWATLGVSSCRNFVTLDTEVFHNFIIQVKNDTGSSGSYAYELFINELFFCTFEVSTGTNKPTQNLYGNPDDLGTGSGTGNVQVQYRNGKVTGGRHPLSLALAGLSVEGDNPTNLIAFSTDLDGNSKSEFGIGESVIINALLLNVTSNAVPLVNFEIILSRNGFESSEITGSTGRVNFTRVSLGNIGDTITYLATFEGSVSQNLSSSSASVVITLVSGSQTGSLSSSLSTPFFSRVRPGGGDEFTPVVNNIVHRENIRLHTILVDLDGAPLQSRTIFFYFDKNTTGTFLRYSLSCQTNFLGECSTDPFSFGSTWVSASLVFASFEGDALYLGTNSSSRQFILIGSASDVSIELALVPSNVNPEQSFDTVINVHTIIEGLDAPIGNELVWIWWALPQGNFRIIGQGVSDESGQVTRTWNAPFETGTYNVKVNASVNSLAVESSNVTLTVSGLVNIPDGQRPAQDRDLVRNPLDPFFLVSPQLQEDQANKVFMWFVLEAAGLGLIMMILGATGFFDASRFFSFVFMTFAAMVGVALGLEATLLTVSHLLLFIIPVVVVAGVLGYRWFDGRGSSSG